jgi:hypothetical protein
VCKFLRRGGRLAIPRLLKEMHYTGQSAEVGVYAGEFSAAIMSHWKRGGVHFMVDPYLEHKTGCKSRTLARQHHCRRNSQLHFDKLFNHTRQTLTRKYGQRAKFLRNFSVEAALSMRESSLDFVYLDGRHDQDGVREDLLAWWPALCPGGLLSGHDFSDREVARTIGTLVRNGMLGNASGNAGLGGTSEIWITADHPASWFVFKSPPAC